MLGVPCPCCRGPPPLTLDTVRKNCVTISSIKDEDLLYFSHSNVALSHLPYMVALDRWPLSLLLLLLLGSGFVRCALLHVAREYGSHVQICARCCEDGGGS